MYGGYLLRHPLRDVCPLMLGMTQAELCDAAGVPLITLRRIEGRPDHAGLVSQQTVDRIKSVLEDRGIQFLETGEVAAGPGVALNPTLGARDAG